MLGFLAPLASQVMGSVTSSLGLGNILGGSSGSSTTSAQPWNPTIAFYQTFSPEIQQAVYQFALSHGNNGPTREQFEAIQAQYAPKTIPSYATNPINENIQGFPNDATMDISYYFKKYWWVLLFPIVYIMYNKLTNKSNVRR
jgi:hypothetical protein